ncbi:MAG: tRNA (N6-threonylcarbamoyladenosine(37)-N6)-methyltransferase TrmO [Pseudomonadota bacterium]
MNDPNGTTLRPGEQVLARAPSPVDASITFIGRARTPWTVRGQCPKNTIASDARCRIELDPAWIAALDGLEGSSHLWVLYWLDHARRDFLVQTPGHAPRPLGTFALRSPNRPNPIGIGAVPLERIDGAVLHVRGLDCLDRTPVVDLKPYFASTDSHPNATVGWRADD